MSIYVSYGNYQHAPGEVEYNYTRDIVYNDRREPWAYKTIVAMQGTLLASTTSEMDRKVRSLEAAYSQNDRDWIVRSDNTPLEISIYSGNTVSGVRVTGSPSYPTNRNAAYVTYLNYQVRLEAEIIILNQVRALRSFQESLSFGGGGPRTLHIETAVGLPEKQLGRRHTIYRATQSGSAVGLFFEPDPPDPIFPNDLKQAGEFSYDSGNLLGNRITDLGITWNYQYESRRPISGRPNRWGTV